MSENLLFIPKKYINDYLHYGYIPELGFHQNFFQKLGFEKASDSDTEALFPEGINEDLLIKRGIQILDSIFDELLNGLENEMHLIPFSGGLDSRLIIAAIRERVPEKNIQTVTFGSPGSFDYEIPKQISKKLNLNSNFINCLNLDFSLENLIKASLNGGRWTSTPDMYINQLSLFYPQNINRWTGFFGGEIAGYYSKVNLGNLDKNYIKFSEYQRRSKNFTLTQKNFSPHKSLLKIPFIPEGLTAFEAIYIYNRSAAGALPILYPNNQTLISPFLHNKWIDFISKVPQEFRNNGILYEKILLEKYPEIMKFPTKNYNGLGLGSHSYSKTIFNFIKLKVNYERNRIFPSLQNPPKGINYIYYKEAFKELPSLRNSIEVACISLEENNIIDWFSPRKILSDHLNNKNDYSQALLILLGLYVNLKAESIQPYISKHIEL